MVFHHDPMYSTTAFGSKKNGGTQPLQVKHTRCSVSMLRVYTTPSQPEIFKYHDSNPLLCIQEVPGLNLGLETGYPD
jgi:hypothetical protein